MKKHVQLFEDFVNEADYWKVNIDTSKVFPVKNDKQAESLLSGKIVTGCRVEKDFDVLDVYGKKQTLRRETVLDVHFLINSDNEHRIYVDRKEKRYFPSDYRGKDQVDLFESNTTDINNEALVAESKTISDPEVEKKLEDKSKHSGIPIGILRTLMRRGMERYKSSLSHSNRWNATEKEYGYARVDSFIRKDKSTWGDVDSDLAKSLNENGYVQIEESYYPKSRGGALESHGMAEEVGRRDVKIGNVIIGTLIFAIQPHYKGEDIYRVGITLTSYPLDNKSSSSTGSIVYSGDEELTKKDAVEKCKDMMKITKMS